jgi:hypothetical protein
MRSPAHVFVSEHIMHIVGCGMLSGVFPFQSDSQCGSNHGQSHERHFPLYDNQIKNGTSQFERHFTAQTCRDQDVPQCDL